MRASTLWQPWASLVAIGAKPYETRSYPPPAKLIGQRIAIHAAVRKVPVFNPCPPEAWVLAIKALSTVYGDFSWSDLPRGAVVATAVISGAYQCGMMDDVGQVFVTRCAQGQHISTAPVFFQSDPFGDYSPGRWAWLLTDVQRLADPVPAKGRQGWWEWEGNSNG